MARKKYYMTMRGGKLRKRDKIHEASNCAGIGTKTGAVAVSTKEVEKLVAIGHEFCKRCMKMK